MLSSVLLVSALATLPSVEELTFTGATSLKLSGELMTPAGDGPFPCALLMPGSGPTDRDGNQPTLKTDLLKQIAERLAADGIATFRFDKRPVARYLSSWPISEGAEAISEFFSFDNHVEDVAAAYMAMTGHKKVDADRCAIVGHSEGGLFASWEAHLLKPKALVLIGTAGQTMVGVMRYQIGRSYGRPGVSAKLRKEVNDSNEAAMKSLVETGKLPDKVHPDLLALYNPSALSLVRSYLTIDPVVPLAKYSGPVLVMNGEKDFQVQATVDAVLLMVALQTRKDGVQEKFIVPNASHNLKPVKSALDPAFTGPATPAALDKLSEWLKHHLGA